MNPVPKPATYHDEDYLAFIRTIPCSHCADAAEPHHLAGKENDYAAVPLCRRCHQYAHQYGLQGFESRFSTNANRLNLWKDAHRHFLAYVMGRMITEAQV